VRVASFSTAYQTWPDRAKGFHFIAVDRRVDWWTVTTREEDMNRYIIQQEASGWFWRLEYQGGWPGWFWSGWSWFWPRAAGPFVTAEEAEQDARNNQFRRFRRGGMI
jgi:hypothetical protein